MSNEPTYTEIPPTTDLNYWELKSMNKAERSKVFVPKDRDLHRKLLAVNWDKSQQRLDRNRQFDVTRIKKR